jgi:hypothetical protein
MSKIRQIQKEPLSKRKRFSVFDNMNISPSRARPSARKNTLNLLKTPEMGSRAIPHGFVSPGAANPKNFHQSALKSAIKMAQ